jgi:regulatory protein
MKSNLKITRIVVQSRNKNRVNVFIDNVYSLSLDIYQLSQLNLKVGQTINQTELAQLKTDSQFGKLYSQALGYCLKRPRSNKEIKDYLSRKIKVNNKAKDKILEVELIQRVQARLAQKGYLDDEKFARFWIENYQVKKGVSRRKLASTLRAKGVEKTIVNVVLAETARHDLNELEKVVNKKRVHYQDERRLIAYLVRQGFSYDEVLQVLNKTDN